MYIPKKALISFVSSLLTGCLLSVAALAYSGPGIVNVQPGHHLNVRQSGNTRSPILGVLAKGAQVSVSGGSNGWFQITYNGRKAFVSQQYVLVPGADTVRIPEAKLAPVPSADAAQMQDAKNAQIQTLLNTAKSMLGVRYVYGGDSLNGTDCSGLTSYCYGKIGIDLPHSSLAQSKLGTAVNKADLKQGDLVFFDTDGGHSNVSHVGLFIGDNQFISAQSGRGKVMIASLSNSYWARNYLFARRILS